jgi:hypothetical protein
MLSKRFSIEQNCECTRPLAHAIALEAVTPSLSMGTGPCCRSSSQALRLQHHSQVLRVFTAAFFAAQTSFRILTFSASVSMRHANGCNVHAQSGCLPCGSLLTNQLRQSATRHRQVGRASYGARRSASALRRSTSIRQNLWKSIQGSAPMHTLDINIHWHSSVFSSALASAPRLTWRSTGHEPCLTFVDTPT